MKAISNCSFTFWRNGGIIQACFKQAVPRVQMSHDIYKEETRASDKSTDARSPLFVIFGSGFAWCMRDRGSIQMHLRQIATV